MAKLIFTLTLILVSSYSLAGVGQDSRLNNVEAVADRAHVRINEVERDVKDLHEDQKHLERRVDEVERQNRNVAKTEHQANRNSKDITSNKAEQNRVNKAAKDVRDQNASGIKANKDELAKQSSRLDANGKLSESANRTANENRESIGTIAEATVRANADIQSRLEDQEKRASTAITANSDKIASNAARIDTLEHDFKQMGDRVNRMEGKLSNGIAGVAAMSSIRYDGSGVGVGVSSYNGSNAIAIGAGITFGENEQWGIHGSLSHADSELHGLKQSDTIGAASVSYSFK